MAQRPKDVANPSAALGEAVGKLFEQGVIECLRSDVEIRGHSIRQSRLENGTGNKYQIDAVIFDQNGDPVVIVEPKYIRYTKHNRDKGSWLCTAHYSLRKTFPTIRKSIAVLAGRWSQPSKALMHSFGVQIFEVPFERIVSILERYGLDFDWPEKAHILQKRQVWEAYCDLNDSDLTDISMQLVADIEKSLNEAVKFVLETDIDSLPRRISTIEVLMKTEQDEFVMKTFDSAAGALGYLTSYITDSSDIGDLPAS